MHIRRLGCVNKATKALEEARRLSSLFRDYCFLMGAAPFSLFRLKNTAINSARLISSSTAVLRPWSHDIEASDDGESTAYKSALKLQRPTTVQYNRSLRNSVSLIGEIEKPLKECNCSVFGVYTSLKVKRSTGVSRDFWVLLKFWGEMAEVSVQHLKPNDLVYVLGCLRSYMKTDEDGEPMRKYEVTVSEMNFVSESGSWHARQNHVKLEQEAEDIKQKRRNRHHLWQIFFANPYEWWDNRKRKLNPDAPDFRHKDTGEALWLKYNDPPWIHQQLQLLDSRLGKHSTGQRRNALNLSPLVYDDFQTT